MEGEAGDGKRNWKIVDTYKAGAASFDAAPAYCYVDIANLHI